MNFFNETEDDGPKANTTKNGIAWTSTPRGPPQNLGFNASIGDQIHHVVAMIPPSVYQGDKGGKMSFGIPDTVEVVETIGTLDIDLDETVTVRWTDRNGKVFLKRMAGLGENHCFELNWKKVVRFKCL